MIKKITAVITSLIIATTLFAGCSDDNDNAKITISDPTTKEEALQLATQIMNAAKKGTDFDELMNKYSEDTGLSTNPDGYIFTYNEMVQPFEEASFALDVNGISDVVETTYGYHVIKRMPIDKDYYDNNSENLISIYNNSLLNEKLQEMTENCTVELSDELADLTPTNYKDFAPQYAMKVDNLEIPAKLFLFLYVSSISQTENTEEYWEEHSEEAEEIKQQAIEDLKLYAAIQLMADENDISLSADEITSFENDFSSYITYYFGSEETLSQILESMATDLDTFKTVQKTSYLKQKIYTEKYGENLIDGATEEDVINYIADTEKSNYVRVKHILVMFPEEETTETTTGETSETSAEETTTSEETTATEETTAA